jgi:serine/threonine protein phosphatase PrpC
MSAKVFVGEGTDPGRVREENQDATSFYRTSDDVWTLLIVCDGMGGHAGGRQAAAMASEGIGQEFANRVSSSAPVDALRDSIKVVNRKIVEHAEVNTELRGMGTTCVVLAVARNQAYVAHVGDSRVYRIRPGSVEQVTKDHSYVQRMIDSGILTPEQAEEHPDANMLMRCLGGRPDVEVDVIGPEPVVAGDRYLLCSDGLWGQVNAAEIAAMSMAFSAQDAVNRLINLANERGGPDNISVQIYHQGDAHPPTGSFSPEKFTVKNFADSAEAGGSQTHEAAEKTGFRKPGLLVLGFIAVAVLGLLVLAFMLSKKHLEIPAESRKPVGVEKEQVPKHEPADAASVSNNGDVSSVKESKPPEPAAVKNQADADAPRASNAANPPKASQSSPATTASEPTEAPQGKPSSTKPSKPQNKPEK